MNSERLVVCVPTYRRSAQLARLLHALEDQRDVDAFTILVGNNDDRPLRDWPELRDPALPAFREMQVTIRGVSAVRNAMLDEAARDPTVRWIACLDDDQVPDADWLSVLVAVGRRHDADLVGGPVLRTAAASTFWSHAATDASFLPTMTGPTTMLNEAGNLLVATRLLRRLDRPPFSLEFGRTGGEDYEFFLFARGLGARIVWAADARVVEPLPADRLTARGFGWREYSIAAYQTRADLRHRGVPWVVASIARAALRVPLSAWRAMRRRPRLASFVGALYQAFAGLAGRIAGLAGLRAERYGGEGGDIVRVVRSAGRASE